MLFRSYLVDDITRSVPAEMNQAFFDKVLGAGKATDEKSFLEQVTEIIQDNYKREAQYLLRIDAENEPYEVYFTKDTVKKLAQNYLKKKLI